MGKEVVLQEIKEAPVVQQRWFTPVILATQEAEIEVPSQPRQLGRSHLKNTLHKKGLAD
jgi:hypothetical protein